ncbi:MAG TPA: adenylate/guanylate cyclase domain-containing protein, partial [Chitinophagaceae bacterium]
MASTHQLAAIMFTDIVGYTALMEEDEEKALQLLETNRALQKPQIEQHGGKWIKEIGDAVLASFPSVTDAVSCACSINKDCEKVDGLQLRIGIHLGDVVFENKDVFGDGVNIASRLQALAPVGSIWASEAVYKNIINKKEITARFVREELLKNVKEPIRIYEIITDEKKKTLKPASSSKNALPAKKATVSVPKSYKRIFFIIAIVILLAVSVFAWFYSGQQTNQIKSLAVMPFLNESGNMEIEYLSDGMTETLISSLSQLPDLDVKARSSVFRYKGKDANAQTIGKELKVQALLIGRIVQRGQDLSLYTELIDTQKETVLWSADYKQPMTGLVALQSEITRDLLQKLKTKISGAEEKKLAKNYTANSEAYRHYLKGRYFWNQRTGDGLIKAIEEFQKAITYDTLYALADSGLADCYLLRRGWTGASSGEMYQHAKESATRALQIDPSLAEAHASMGLVYYHGWQWKESEAEYKLSIDLNPRYASAHQWYSLWLEVMGRKHEALDVIKRAQELEPLSPIITANLARQYALMGHVDSAIKEARDFIELNPGSGVMHQVLALSLHLKGENEKAIETAKKAVDLTNRDDRPLAMYGLILGKAGKHAEAIALLKEMEEKYYRQQA